VLVAILPYVSDFCHKLNLPVSTPVSTNGVRFFRCDNRQDHVGGLVVLTNGYQFTFMDGRVCVYRSPWSYYSLQNFDVLPKFYGKAEISKDEALRAAHQAIVQLGYTDPMLCADGFPKVTLPEKTGSHLIPRYRFQWLKPKSDSRLSPPDILPVALDMEINAQNGRVEMFCIIGTNGSRAGPKVDVVPLLLNPPSAAGDRPRQTLDGGGIKTDLVSPAYAKAFLQWVLPRFSDYAARACLPVRVPITIEDVDISQYQCWSESGRPAAQVILKNGDRFNFENGHVSGFYAHDAYFKFPFTGDPEKFTGKINMTTNEVFALGERTIRSIGYKDKLPEPFLEYPELRGPTNFSRRIFACGKDGIIYLNCEIDLETKTVKGIMLDQPSQYGPDPDLHIPMMAPTNAPNR
jgi:hypothetical protein